MEAPKCLACSSSRLASEFMQLPRYLKVSTFFSAFPSMVMLGGSRLLQYIKRLKALLEDKYAGQTFHVSLDSRDKLIMLVCEDTN